MLRWCLAVKKTLKTNKIYLPDVIGKGYKTFWNFRGKYRVVKGSRASKKSKTTALYFIYNLMKYPGANLLVVRKVFRTIADSCYKELQWATDRLGVSHLWEFKTSPLEATYIPTGQKIYFRGFDDPLKITSITVKTGSLCWVWVEEAYEIMHESDFDMLNESVRGVVPDGLFKQFTLTFNPWNEHHWIKEKFFDTEDDSDILAITTNYMCNEWLDESDFKMFETMKEKNPRRYQVAGLGEWGIVDGLVFENWEEKSFDLNPDLESAFGLDFGYTNDPSALFCGQVDKKNKIIYVFDEMYKKGMSNEKIHEAITKMGYSKEKITADSSEPKSIARLRELGIIRIKRARKGKDSISNGIDNIQDYKIIIHPRCVNFITEISNYAWEKDKFGKKTNRPIDDFNHMMDAMRYALEDVVKGDKFSFE
ncbi:MAG: PBSX family phage terminase large subunit [Anaerovoracaceae bacterium]